MSLTFLRKAAQVKHLALLALAVCLGGSSACSKELGVTAPGREFSGSSTLVGSGVMGSTTLSVSGFRGIRLQSVGTVRLQQGSSESVRIEAEDNLLEIFDAQVHGGMLEIGTKPGKGFRSSLPITFYVSARDIERFAVEGPGQIEAVGLSTNRLSIEVTGPGAVELNNLSAVRLETTVSGPGRVSLSGAVASQLVHNSGPGSFDGRRLRSADAEVELSGTGDVTLSVSGSLRARISGSGSVYYVGDPVVDSTVNGTGSIVQIGG